MTNTPTFVQWVITQVTQPVKVFELHFFLISSSVPLVRFKVLNTPNHWRFDVQQGIYEMITLITFQNIYLMSTLEIEFTIS